MTTTPTAAPLSSEQLEQQRELFEQHFGLKDSFAWRNTDGSYKVYSLQQAWEIWQAAIAQARSAAPAGQADEQALYKAALLAVERMRGCAATYIEDHARDSYPGQVGLRPQDVAEMWAQEIHSIDAKAYLDEAIADLAAPVAGQQAAPAQQAGEAPTIEQIADAVSRLIGAHVVDWTSHHDEEDEPFSSDAHERAHLCDMIRKYATTPAPTAADTTASASGHKQKYDPDNPPRLRNPGESVRDYRVAMGWEQPDSAAHPVQAGEAVDEHDQAVELTQKLERDGFDLVCMDGSPNVVGIIKAAWEYRATPPSPSTAPTAGAQTACKTAETRMNTDFDGGAQADGAAPIAEGELPPLPTLPRYLLDMIGEYGMARTDTVGQLEVQHRWETLIGGIKRYSRAYGQECARAAVAPNPAAREAARQSIDTPEFREIFRIWDSVIPGVNDEEEIMQRIIAHIDTWGGAALAANTATQKE